MKSKQLPNSNIERLELPQNLSQQPKKLYRSAATKEGEVIETLTFVGVIKCDYSVRYAFSKSDGTHIEMTAKDFYAAIPYMNRGKVTGKFRLANIRGKPGIVFIRE